jgi:uncharacterized membrane protein
MSGRVWFGVALTLSLALNAFLAGWVLSPRLASRTPASAEQAPAFRALMHRIQALPEPARSQTHLVVRGYLPRLRAEVRKLRAAREDLRTLLESPQYSRAEATMRLASVREHSAALQTLAQQMVLDIADHLPPETRARLMLKLDWPR